MNSVLVAVAKKKKNSNHTTTARPPPCNCNTKPNLINLIGFISSRHIIRSTCCPGGGFKNVELMAPHLNEPDGWCMMVNKNLLYAAGYRCFAKHWITHGSKGERQEHMVIAIEKFDAGPSKVRDSNL